VTIWDVAPRAIAVVESPNLLGRLEPVTPGHGEALLIQHAGSPVPAGQPRAVVVTGSADTFHVYTSAPSQLPPPDLADLEADFRARTEAARRLAKSLNQIPGVRLAHGDAESPAFVALLPVAPGPVAAAVSGLASGVTAEALDEMPGLPAALLVTIAAKVEPAAKDRWLGGVGNAVKAPVAKGVL
jgi:hypothetical protein